MLGGKLLSSNREQTIQKQGVNIHLMQTKKFKTINIVAKLRAPLQRDTITKRALIPYLLNQGTKKYPSQKEFQSKLDELFGANLSIDGMKKGDYHIISFRLEIASESFLENNKTLLEDGLQLLYEVIFQPNVENNQFQAKTFEREKETLKNEISSIVDNKTAYANLRLIDEMFKGDKYQLHVQGYEEDLESLTAEDVYDYYTNMLQTDALDIYILGYYNEAAVLDSISELFTRSNVHLHDQITSKMIEQVEATQEIVEKESINQAKLHIGYTTNCTYQDKEYFALHIFNGLFGSFPSSKLFVHVREKNSLAYYVSSRLESHKGLLIVFCGIDGTNYEKTIQIIDEQLQALKDGQFTDTDLNETKELVISQLKETLDYPQGMVELAYQQVLGSRQLTASQLIEQINNVTKQDVIAVAQNIQKHTTYLLKNERSDHNETNDI